MAKKSKKAKRKRTNGDKGFDDYLAKKLQYLQESHEQDREALRIKADKVRVDVQRADIEKERLRLETIREAQRANIETQRLRLETIREERRIMTMDTSGMNDKERLYFENLKDQILARQQLE